MSSAKTRGLTAPVTSMLTVPSVSLAMALPVRARLVVPAESLSGTPAPGLTLVDATDSTIVICFLLGSQEKPIRMSSESGAPKPSAGASGLSSKFHTRESCAKAGAACASAMRTMKRCRPMAEAVTHC